MKKHCGCTKRNPVPENHGQDLDDETQRQVAHDLATLPTRVYGRASRGSATARRNPTSRVLMYANARGPNFSYTLAREGGEDAFANLIIMPREKYDRVTISAATPTRTFYALYHVYRATGDVEYQAAWIDGKMVDTDAAIDEYGAVVDWFARLYDSRLPPLEGGRAYVVNDFPDPSTRTNPITPSTPDMLNERWVDGLLRDPSHPQWTRRRAWRTADIKVDGQTQRLTVKRDAETHASMNTTICLWYLGPKDSPVAAGVAYTDGDAIRLSATAVRVHARRRGVYRAVIVALRKLFGVPIESDDSMAEGAIRAWQAAGAAETKRRGTTVMRINPARPPRRGYDAYRPGLDSIRDALTRYRIPLAHYTALERVVALRGQLSVFEMPDQLTVDVTIPKRASAELREAVVTLESMGWRMQASHKRAPVWLREYQRGAR